MGKYDDDNYLTIDVIDAKENSDNEKLSKEDFTFEQMDEHYDIQSNSYEFLKSYIEKRNNNNNFPIAQYLGFKNFTKFINKFIIPLGYE